MFTLTSVLLWGVLLILFLFIVLLVKGRTNYLSWKPRFGWVYYVILCSIGVLSITTVKRYMYPQDPDIFKNTDYHILEHKGFQTGTPFYLVREDAPNQALWDDKEGVVRIDSASIYIKDLCEPFFVEKKLEQEGRHKGNLFALANKTVQADLSQEALTITRKNGSRQDTLYHLQMVQNGKKALYISSSTGNKADTSAFTRIINRAYPLSDIIANSVLFNFDEELQALLEGTMLVREEIAIINEWGGEREKGNESPLLLVPGRNLYAASHILINGTEPKHDTFEVPYTGETLIYSGEGRNKSDIFYLRHGKEKGTLELRYVLPKMQKLRSEGGRLFLSSSIESIIEDSKDGGYYYGLFDSESNYNHINAELRYAGGTSREAMTFQIFDIQSDNPTDKKIVGADTEFTLMGRGAKDIHTTLWIFDVMDLRAANSLQFIHLFVFILVFIFLVGIRILVQSLNRDDLKNLTFTELSLYVLILCMCTVRLVLAWRASTFVPIEGVSAAVFYKMTDGYGIWIKTLVISCTFPVICTIAALTGHKDWRLPQGERFNWLVFGVFFLISLLCVVVNKGFHIAFLERILNIPVPVLTYLLADWLVVRGEGQNKKVIRILMPVITAIFLFIQDAGFIIIFFVFLLLLHGVIGPLVNRKEDWRKKWLPYALSLTSCLVLLFILKYEGHLIIQAFNIAPTSTKAHIKYRAQIQMLPADEKIDRLIEQYDFQSSDLTYIMRSAHNQWFINQYLQAGENNSKYFTLQPHSNQGSTYTTQTTDLVITRYVMAEHNKWLVFLFVILFLECILICCQESALEHAKNRLGVSALVLMFALSLMVFLSATNRIVFIGQDFPLISIQSFVALLFPIALMLLAVHSVEGGMDDSDNNPAIKLWITGELIGLFIACYLLLPPLGKGQNEKQFNVSQLVQDVSERASLLDRRLVAYQEENPKARKQQMDDLWKAFLESGYARPYEEAMADESKENHFYKSLLEYFTYRQVIKNNPEELLHLRKRNGYWHLAVNKTHYSIPSPMEELYQWSGELLAAKTKHYFKLSRTDRSGTERLLNDRDYKSNILPKSVQQQVANVRVFQFDPFWTDQEEEPMLLISANQAIGSKQFFHIESMDESIRGSASEHQLATRLNKGDLLIVNTLDKKREEVPVLIWRFGEDSENYLARNIWINGKQQLFYPLGKESMWSYQFANTVSSVLADNDQYRDSTIRVSIDFDLHKSYYQMAREQMASIYRGNSVGFSAIALDGNGRIRLLFDYARSRDIDPNNIRSYNKLVSDLYKDGDNRSEKEVFGNKALQIIPSGPGSTFKPIAYTSITSQEKINWKSLDVLSKYMGDTYVREKYVGDVNYYNSYGGVVLSEQGEGSLAIAGGAGSLRHDNYLTHSNNLYHSAIILMGMQQKGSVERIFKPAEDRPIEFPLMTYNQKTVTFNPDVWFANKELNVETGIMNAGLLNNFHLRGDFVREKERYTNYFGDSDLYSYLFNNAKSHRIWSYTATGSLNTFDRRLSPKIHTGFNQMLTGAYPLEVTPLQMAVMGMRLVTLNREENLTTLDDNCQSAPHYSFFDTPGWTEKEYLEFYKEQVLAQLEKVPVSGTARALSGLANELKGKGYYLYAKTGTLNIESAETSSSSRMKHLMVIISNKDLTKIASAEEMKAVKYYVLYLSYYGVELSIFNNHFYDKYIRAVVNSELFNTYMKEDK